MFVLAAGTSILSILILQSGSQTPQSRFGNAYYHFNPTCVWMRFPEFVSMYLEVPPEICEQLEAPHKERLQHDFQVHIAKLLHMGVHTE